jgi:hypothetical protein
MSDLNRIIKYKLEISGFKEINGIEEPFEFKDLTESELAHIFILISKGQISGVLDSDE